MRYLFSLLILLLLTLIQVSFLPVLLPAVFIPHLVLLYIFAHFALNPSRSGLLAGFLGGLLVDLTQPVLVGASSLLILLILATMQLFST